MSTSSLVPKDKGERLCESLRWWSHALLAGEHVLPIRTETRPQLEMRKRNAGQSAGKAGSGPFKGFQNPRF